MKKQFLFSLLALSAATGAKADGNEARLLRFPATNGTDIVFSYAGDLYTAPIAGGEARRLTSHVGYEIFPRFSPGRPNPSALPGERFWPGTALGGSFPVVPAYPILPHPSGI